MARTSVARVLAVVVVALAACSRGGDAAEATTEATDDVGPPRTTLALVTHQAPGDTFWDLVRRGADAAAANHDIDLRYSHDPDAADQAKLVRAAIDGKVAGIAVTLAVPDVMEPAVQAASIAEIPVVALNSGIAAWKAMGVLEFFGQDEMIAGEAAGERFALEEGAERVVHHP